MDNLYIHELRIQKKSVIKKLYAAGCLLLVSSLLLTTTSFAWLTLSLTPEVTNVTTTIGANGNLEIALGKNISESTIGDSFDKNKVTTANRTWGNLIDLTDNSYGLHTINLRPAILNSAGGAINKLHPLSYPIYGADGRVQYIYANNMFAGTYNGEQFVTTPNDYGVHGIGVTQYHAPGVGGTFGPLSQRQEIFYYAQNNLFSRVDNSLMSLCKNNQSVLRAYKNGLEVPTSNFNLDVFYEKVAAVVSAANEDLRTAFTLLATSKTTSANNYFMAIDLLKKENPDYELIQTLVTSAIQAENIECIGTAIAELRTLQNTLNQLKIVIDSGAINSNDGYSMNEIAQTVGMIFDLEKTNLSKNNEDYWIKVIPDLHYNRYVYNNYWWDDVYGLAMNNVTNSLSSSNGQDNDSRETMAYNIAHTNTYTLYRSLPLEELDQAIAGLYLSHWEYWDRCAEEYKQLQSEIEKLETHVKQLEDFGALEDELLSKTTELSNKKDQLQSLIDGEIYALDDDRIESIRNVMVNTIEIIRQYTLWSIAYIACDGQIPEDAYRRILEIVNSTDYIHPRKVYQMLCDYGVRPEKELTNMVATYEKLEQQLIFSKKDSQQIDSITWSELNKELQRIFGTIEHTFYIADSKYIHDIYSNSLFVEDTPFPIDVMQEIADEIKKCEAALGSATTSKNLKHIITYKYLDEVNIKPWAQALGLLNSFETDTYPFEYGTSVHTIADRMFSTEHSMWYAECFNLRISIGVGSEDNFNKSGMTVRQTQFKEAQETVSYYQDKLIKAAVNPDSDMVTLLMQIIAGENSISVETISKYLGSLQQQLDYAENMMYQAALAMAFSSYAEDDLYNYVCSNNVPKDATGMIALLQNYDFDETVLSIFAQRMELLNNQKHLLDQSLMLMENYKNPNTDALKVKQISASEAVNLLNPVLDTDNMTLYVYVADGKSNNNQSSKYIHTVMYAGYGSKSVKINGNQAVVTGREPVTIFGDVYLSLEHSFSGGMLALAKSQTESYSSPTDKLTADEIVSLENGVNRYSYSIDENTKQYTLNLRTGDADYSLENDLWTYIGNTENISANQTLVDMYGYSIDLSFRTNIEASDLLLQTEAVDRIYKDGEAQTNATMGAGSFMEFEKLDPSFSTNMAKEYMSCLRVVFTDTNTGYIYGYSALDMNAAEELGDKIKAPLRLYDKDTGLIIEGDTAQHLCHLEKNLEKNITVYVYLDGAKTSQSFVSSKEEISLTGMLNLQFSSSADLKPAKIGDFH